MKTGKKCLATLLATLALSATAYAAPLPPSDQAQILARMVNNGGQGGGWCVLPEQDKNWNRWFYAVTDLDHDGKLEIFMAKRGGENDDGEMVMPEIRCEELNENGEGRSWGLFLAGNSDVPDIMTSEAATMPTMLYEPAANDYHYIFVSSRPADGDEWDFTDTKVALTLHGDLIVEDLAMMKVKLAEPGSDLATRKFFLPAWRSEGAESDPSGLPEEIDAQRYADIELARFGTEAGQTAAISWYRAEEIRALIGLAKLPQVLESSYKAFAKSVNL
ncbi:MAG: hypothetical protein IJS96_02245 [Schwartzia sp.]|nr:hypothetical protein [Schwartzia sp. (in: firmicutes)]